MTGNSALKNVGFGGREHPEEFPTGRWILAFTVGDAAWWIAWMFICKWTEASDLLGAIFVGTSFFGQGLYTFGVRLPAAIIVWAPVLLTATIAYKREFGDRSGWPILVWFGAACVLNFLTRFLVMFALLT